MSTYLCIEHFAGTSPMFIHGIPPLIHPSMTLAISQIPPMFAATCPKLPRPFPPCPMTHSWCIHSLSTDLVLVCSVDRAGGRLNGESWVPCMHDICRHGLQQETATGGWEAGV